MNKIKSEITNKGTEIDNKINNIDESIETRTATVVSTMGLRARTKRAVLTATEKVKVGVISIGSGVGRGVGWGVRGVGQGVGSVSESVITLASKGVNKLKSKLLGSNDEIILGDNIENKEEDQERRVV